MCQVEDAALSCLIEDGFKIEITDTFYIVQHESCEEPSKIPRDELLSFAEGFYTGRTSMN